MKLPKCNIYICFCHKIPKFTFTLRNFSFIIKSISCQRYFIITYRELILQLIIIFIIKLILLLLF